MVYVDMDFFCRRFKLRQTTPIELDLIHGRLTSARIFLLDVVTCTVPGYQTGFLAFMNKNRTNYSDSHFSLAI